MILVVDASIAAKWYLNEMHSGSAEKLLDSNVFQLHAPDLLLPEVGNVLWKKRRSGELLPSECERIGRNLREREVTYHRLCDLFTPALIASQYSDRPIYDWYYVVLARSLRIRFVTADRRFFLAMRSTAFRSTMMWIEELEQN
jgi:predicted nucleic acid-binding protein